jgi:hypothetical protein
MGYRPPGWSTQATTSPSAGTRPTNDQVRVALRLVDLQSLVIGQYLVNLTLGEPSLGMVLKQMIAVIRVPYYWTVVHTGVYPLGMDRGTLKGGKSRFRVQSARPYTW